MGRRKKLEEMPISHFLETEYGFTTKSYLERKGIRYTRQYIDGIYYRGWENIESGCRTRHVEWLDLLESHEEFTISPRFLDQESVVKNGWFVRLNPQFNHSNKLEFQNILAKIIGGRQVPASELDVRNFDFDERYKIIKIYPEYAYFVACISSRFDELEKSNFPFNESIVLSTSLLTYAHDVFLLRNV